MFITSVSRLKRLQKIVFNNPKFVLWVEEYLFYPRTFVQKALAYALLPFSFIYCFIVLLKRIRNKRRCKSYGIPIVSIGNLTVGGNGKTPFGIALAKNYSNVAIVLRGYGRKSHGLLVVSNQGQTMCDALASGDEAMLYAKSLPDSTVIVSEDRVEAIRLAKKMGAKIIFMDDGFSKRYIEKIDILIRPNPEPEKWFCLPSGPYREPRFLYEKADLVIEENRDFFREVSVVSPTEKMLLVTAISKPQRLDPYLPENVIDKVYYPDHYIFSELELQTLLENSGATSILTTQKDAVKMATFELPISLLKLDVTIDPDILEKINTLLAAKR